MYVPVLLKEYGMRLFDVCTADPHCAHEHKPSFFGVFFSLINSFLGILIISRIDEVFVMEELDMVMIVGSFGAQATLVFGAPSSPLAQPYNCIVGNAISSFIGVSVYKVV